MLRRFWVGRGRLSVVFWRYGVLGNILIAGLLAYPGGMSRVNAEFFALLMVLLGGYNLWVVVSIWRCAYNVDRKYWGDLARMMAVCWAINCTLVWVFVALDQLAQ